MRYLPLMREVEGSDELVLDGVVAVCDHCYDIEKEYMRVLYLDGTVESIPLAIVADRELYALQCIELERSIRETIIQ